MEPLKALVKEADSQIPVNDIQPVNAVVWSSIAPSRFVASLIAFFAAVALLLGAFGIFGLTSYLVQKRRHEIGVRMTLGAAPERIRREVVGISLWDTSIGIVLGFAGAWISSAWLEHLLFNVGRLEWSIFALSAALLGTTAVIAAYWPARRAARLDPLTAIRSE